MQLDRGGYGTRDLCGGVAQWLERRSMTGDGRPPRGKPSTVCRPTWPTQPFILLRCEVSLTQAFAMRMCVVAPHGQCSLVKADMVVFAGNDVLSISERVRGVREYALYQSTLPLPLLLPFRK